jgi:hypothetical protein
MAVAFAQKDGESVASTGIVASNHNDAFNLKLHLQAANKVLGLCTAAFDQNDLDVGYCLKFCHIRLDIFLVEDAAPKMFGWHKLDLTRHLPPAVGSQTA